MNWHLQPLCASIVPSWQHDVSTLLMTLLAAEVPTSLFRVESCLLQHQHVSIKARHQSLGSSGLVKLHHRKLCNRRTMKHDDDIKQQVARANSLQLSPSDAFHPVRLTLLLSSLADSLSHSISSVLIQEADTLTSWCLQPEELLPVDDGHGQGLPQGHVSPHGGLDFQSMILATQSIQPGWTPDPTLPLPSWQGSWL